MNIFKVSLLSLSIMAVVGCNNDNTQNNHIEPNQNTVEQPNNSEQIAPLQLDTQIRGQLAPLIAQATPETSNYQVTASESGQANLSTHSFANHAFIINSQSTRTPNNLRLSSSICLANNQCITLTHQLHGEYHGEILPLDLRTTLIDHLVRHFSTQPNLAQKAVNDYLNIGYNIPATTIIPVEHLDQVQVFADFIESAATQNLTLDQYMHDLAKQILANPALRHEKRINSTFKPRFTGSQFIQEVIEKGNTSSLWTLLSSQDGLNNADVKADIAQRLLYLNATASSMHSLQLQLNELQLEVSPLLENIKKKYDLELLNQNNEAIEHDIPLIQSIIFDLNNFQYITDLDQRKNEIERIDTILKHLTVKQDELSYHLQETAQAQTLLNAILKTSTPTETKDLEKISKYITYYVSYFDHLNAISYYLLAEDAQYHASTSTACLSEGTNFSVSNINTTHNNCQLYKKYLDLRSSYFNSSSNGTVQGSINNLGSISATDIAGMDIETALLAVQGQRATLLETQLKEQIDAIQKKNEQVAKLNAVLGQLNMIKATLPSDAKADQLLSSASTIHQTSLDEAEKSAYGSARYLSKKPLDQITIAELDGFIQTVKNQTDSLNNTQQMDILRLQSLSNKRNEAFELMSNFIKKMQDSRDSIISNMR